MLRLAVLLLVLANAGYFAWSQGFLAPWGFTATPQTEPHRLEQQIKPQALRLVASEEARRLEAATAGQTPRPNECLQAGLFEAAQLGALRQALEPWPTGSWSLEAAAEPPRWIVYMGKYASAENAARKKAELRQLNVTFEALSDPALEPGVSLGGFTTEAAAAQQLEVLAQRGVRTAKVVQERAQVSGQLLKLASLDDALRARLEELRPALNGKTLRPCR